MTSAAAVAGEARWQMTLAAAGNIATSLSPCSSSCNLPPVNLKNCPLVSTVFFSQVSASLVCLCILITGQ